MFKALFLTVSLLGLTATANVEAPAEDVGVASCWNGDNITGPIWSNDHAQEVCPAVCSNIGGSWTGNWTTVIWGQRSVCNCTVCG